MTDGKKEKHKMYSSEVAPGTKVGLIPHQARGGGGERRMSSNYKEDALIDAIDNKNTITEYADWIEDLRDGTIDVSSFIQGVAPDVAVELLHMAMNGATEKNRLAALTDLLDRAGYGKVHKIAAAVADPTKPKEQLIAMIMGMNRKSKTIEIEEDDEDQAE